MLAVHRLDGQLTVYIIEISRYIFTGGQKFGAQPQSPYQGFHISKGNFKACFARAILKYMVRRALYEVVNATYLWYLNFLKQYSRHQKKNPNRKLASIEKLN